MVAGDEAGAVVRVVEVVVGEEDKMPLTQAPTKIASRIQPAPHPPTVLPNLTKGDQKPVRKSQLMPAASTGSLAEMRTIVAIHLSATGPPSSPRGSPKPEMLACLE